MLWAVVLIGLVVGVPILLFGPVVEILRSLIAIAAPLALVVLMGAVRYVKRLLVERSIGCAQPAKPATKDQKPPTPRTPMFAQQVDSRSTSRAATCTLGEQTVSANEIATSALRDLHRSVPLVRFGPNSASTRPPGLFPSFWRRPFATNFTSKP